MTGDRIAIETSSRWDALELLTRLRRLHAYLIQLGDARWEVCVRPDGEVDRVLAELLATVEAWADERHAESVVRVGERRYAVRG